jgi:hypothetical protein
VVERRQASAPDSGRVGASRLIRGAYRTRWCGHETLRLPAFRFLNFFRSYFVIAGLDPAIHAAKRLEQNSDWLTL